MDRLTDRSPAGSPPAGLPRELDPRGPSAGIRRGRRGRLLLGLLAGAVSMAVLLATAGGWFALSYFNGRIAHVSLSFAQGHKRPRAAPAGAANFLLVGSDSRAKGGPQGTGATYVTGERSDTIILAHLSPNGTATLVSFPRDTWVTIPAWRSAKGTVYPAHPAKINSAITEGGPSLTVETIEDLTHVKVDHFLQVDFQGFQAMTQAVGGVDVCLVKAPTSVDGYYNDNLNDGFSGFHGHVGVNRLDGAQALAFVRQRHGLPGGDLDRIKRQQQFIGAVFRKVLSSGTLLDPARLGPFLSAATAALTTDDGTGLTDLRTLATRLRGLSAGKVRFATIPTSFPPDNGSARYGGQSVLVYSPAALSAFLTAIALDGTAPRPAAHASAHSTAAGATTLTVAPSAVSVLVENGTTTTGLGGRVRAALAALGFAATGPADASAGHATSQVRYGPAGAAAARTLAAAVPGSVLVADPTLTGRSLVLVVGAGYSAVSAVHAGQRVGPPTTSTPPAATPAATPTASPTSAPPTSTAAGGGASCTY